MASSPYQMINCSISYITDQWKIGSKQCNGSYDGMIGMMVRGEANSTALAYVLGATDDEPVIVGPVWTTTEMSILSAKDTPSEVIHGAEGWFNNFESQVYMYLIITLFMFAMNYVFTTHAHSIFKRWRHIFKIFTNGGKIKKLSKSTKNRRQKMLIMKLFKMALTTFWKCTTALFRGETFEAPSVGHKFLVLLFSFGIFFLIQGYFLSLTSTDMIAVQPVPIIDTLNDFLTRSHFSHMNASLPDSLWQRAVIEGSRKESPEGELWKRVDYHIPIQMNDFEQLSKNLYPVADNLLNQKKVLVVDKTIIDLCKSVICQVKGYGIGSRLHIARGETFAEKLLTFSISKTSDEGLIKWVNYRQSLLLQSGLTNKFSSSLAYGLRMSDSFTIGMFTECLTPTTHDQSVPVAIKMEFFRTTLYMTLLMISLAFAILCFEICVFKVSPRCHHFFQTL